MEKFFVSVIIPTKDSKETLDKVLESLLLQTWDNYEVVIIDDGSTDNTGELFQGKYFGISNVRYFGFKSNRGRARARNTGIKLSKGGLIIFLDADCVPANKDFIYQHILAHNQMKKCAVIGNTIVDPIVRKRNGVARYRESRYNVNFRKGIDINHVPPKFFSTSNVSVLREDLLLTNLFNDSLTGYGFEDRDLGFQLSEKGISFIFNEKAIVWHLDYNVDFIRLCKREYHIGRNVTPEFIAVRQKTQKDLYVYLGPYSYLEPIDMRNDGLILSTKKFFIRKLLVWCAPIYQFFIKFLSKILPDFCLFAIYRLISGYWYLKGVDARKK